MDDLKGKLKKVGTLGGSITLNPEMKRYYYGEVEPGGAFSKEKLYGIHGPLLIGMPNPESHKEELALRANVSDTRQTLIMELITQHEFTRREAEKTVDWALKSGKLAEVLDESGTKVLVWGGRGQ